VVYPRVHGCAQRSNSSLSSTRLKVFEYPWPPTGLFCRDLNSEMAYRLQFELGGVPVERVTRGLLRAPRRLPEQPAGPLLAPHGVRGLPRCPRWLQVLPLRPLPEKPLRYTAGTPRPQVPPCFCKLLAPHQYSRAEASQTGLTDPFPCLGISCGVQSALLTRLYRR